MSKVVTPPDIIDESLVILVVNADIEDVGMVAELLRYSHKNYTIHLYHDAMDNIDWLIEVAGTAQTILVHRTNTKDTSVKAMYDSIAKIKWIGEGQAHASATTYLANND